MNHIKENEDGTVSHLVYKNADGKLRSFKSMAVFNAWRKDHEIRRRRHFKSIFSPHVFYLTQGGTERAFTGEYVWTLDIGTYACIGCTQRIFLSEHKY